jgi:LPS-assembly protein
MDVNLLGQYTRFSIREREQFGSLFPDGNRTVLYPQVSMPYIRPGWYVTPKLGMNYRRYSLSGQAAGVSNSISVALPVFSVDSGMTFERSSSWFGRDYTQTLEPRLYYLNIPYKDQSDIPLFDTALADFNFAQIFSENQFSGWDRVSNANQLTAALTSRLVEPETGSEIMRAMIGQRFYFTRNKVNLNRIAAAREGEKWNRSDFLAGFSGQILPKIFVDTAWQFDLGDRRSKRYSVEMRYRPEPGKVLNVAYRYNRETTSPVNQVDISGQWPLFGRWHGVGRLNYSFKDDGTVLSTGGQGGRIIESIAGLEYNGGCWIVRGVVRRQALTSEDTSTAFYVQLELSGLGRIGSNPLSLLKRNIQGYGLIGSDRSGSVFDE